MLRVSILLTGAATVSVALATGSVALAAGIPVAAEVELLASNMPLFGALVAVYVVSIVGVFGFARWDHRNEINSVRDQYREQLDAVVGSLNAAKAEADGLSQQLRSALKEAADLKTDLLTTRQNLSYFIGRVNPTGDGGEC